MLIFSLDNFATEYRLIDHGHSGVVAMHGGPFDAGNTGTGILVLEELLLASAAHQCLVRLVDLFLFSDAAD